MPIIFNNKFIYQLIIFYIIKSSSKKLSKGSIGSYNNIKDLIFKTDLEKEVKYKVLNLQHLVIK